MPEQNGVTRREFDRLEQRVQTIETTGTPVLREMERRVTVIENHGSPMVGRMVDRIKNVHEDVVALEKKVDALSRAFWTLVVIVLTGMVSLIVALASGALGSQ